MRPLARIAALFLALLALPGSIPLLVGCERPRPPSEAEARQERLAKAEQGDAKAQYELFSPLSPSAEGLYWLCRAANGGNEGAQGWLGALRHSPEDEPWRTAGLVKWDIVRAHMWYGLAVASGDTDAAAARDDLSEKMTRAQIARAKRMTAKWKPNPGECKRPAATIAFSR